MKLQLNFNKPGNYAFFCPACGLHLTRSNPVGIVNGATPYINRGLKSKAIIEIVEETEGQKAETKKPVKKEETTSSTENSFKKVEKEEEKATETVENAAETTEAEASEDKPKRGRRSSTNS